MYASLRNILFAGAIIGTTSPAFANVITDWDENAITVVAPMANLGNTSPYMAQRMMAMVHVAMFDAVNSIEPRYRPYLVQLSASTAASKEAAAASAAATVLATINEKTVAKINALLAAYLASIPDGAAKSDGIKLGAQVAAKVLEARANDGSDAPDAYRPRTTPGVYVPTTITISSMWPDMKPFVIASPSQFRPAPPIALESKEWAAESTRSRTMADRTVRSAPPSRPRLPTSGSSALRSPFIHSCVSLRSRSR